MVEVPSALTQASLDPAPASDVASLNHAPALNVARPSRVFSSGLASLLGMSALEANRWLN